MPISKRTGKKYAAGSTKSYGGWEPRACHNCGAVLTLKHTAMATNPNGGTPFTLCGECIDRYGDAYADMGPTQNADHADGYACTSQDLHPYECDGPGHCIHCDQLTLEEAQP